MLDAMDEGVTTGIGTLALYTAYSSAGTANEVTGGSPAYARKSATFNAAASGSKALNASVAFDVPATTVRWIGFWSTEGSPVFLGMTPAAGGNLYPFVTDDTSTDRVKVVAQPFSNGDQVVAWAGTNTLPVAGGDLAEGTIYYVVSASTDYLQLSLTSGGAALDFSAKGEGFLQKVVPEVFAAQGTYTVSALTLSLGVA